MATKKPKTANQDTNMQIIVREKGIHAKGYGHIAKPIMIDQALDLGSKSLYAYFSSAAGSGEEAYLRRARVLAEMGFGERAYDTYMNALLDRGYLTRTQSRSAGGVFGTTVIEFVMVPARIADKIDEAKDAETHPTVYSGTIYALGYGIMPRIVARDTRLSYKARGLYAYYAVYANSSKEAFPSRDKILKDLDISKNTYTKLLKELTTLGYVTVNQTHDNAGRLGKTIFRLNMNPEEVLAERAAETKEKNDQSNAAAPCPKNSSTVADMPCPKNSSTVADIPCPKNSSTVEAPCPKNACTVAPCPKNSSTVFNITNTILSTNTNLSLLDRLMDTVRTRIDYSILQFSYENDPMGLETIRLLLESIAEVFSTQNTRVKIGSEYLYTSNVREVLLNISNKAVVAVVERYLSRTDVVANPKAYLLTSLYREILIPTPEPLEDDVSELA